MSPERHCRSLRICLTCTRMHMHANAHRLRWVGLSCTYGLLSVLSTRLSESQTLRRHHLSEGDSLQVSRWPRTGSGLQVPGAATAAGIVLKRGDPLCCSYIPLQCPGKGLQTIFAWVLLALRSPLPDVSLSQEAGPGQWSIMCSPYHGAGPLQ